MPGMTFVTAIFAVLRIPQRTLDIARHHSRKVLGGKTCAGEKSVSRTRIPFLDPAGTGSQSLGRCNLLDYAHPIDLPRSCRAVNSPFYGS
jgi:hypothetical protein